MRSQERDRVEGTQIMRKRLPTIAVQNLALKTRVQVVGERAVQTAEVRVVVARTSALQVVQIQRLQRTDAREEV